MKKRVSEWLPMVLIAWRNKLRISLKYLKQLFSAPRFHKCPKSRKQVWLHILVETRFCMAETGGDLS